MVHIKKILRTPRNIFKKINILNFTAFIKKN